MLDKNLEAILDQWRTPPDGIPDEVPYKSQMVFMPVKVIMAMFGYNYREHTVKEIDNISDSIEQVGLLEPHIITYNTQNREWDFRDGEGRFWSCYQIGADEVPVEIFYNVPSNIGLQMQVALNSTKTKIDSEDIARYVGNVSQSIAQRNYERAGKIGKIDDYYPSTKDLAHAISRSRTTVRNYLVYNSLHSEVVEYVSNHRERNLFSRSVVIGKKLSEKNHQRHFLSIILAEEEKIEKEELLRKREAEKKGEKYTMKSSRLRDHKFRSLLKGYVELVKEKDDGELHMRHYKTSYRDGDKTVRDIYDMTRKTKSYIDAYTNIIEVYPEIKKDSLERIMVHVKLLKSTYDNFLTLLPEETKDALEEYLKKSPKKSFRREILEQAELRRKTKDDGLIKRIKTIGDKIVYVPVDEIELDPNQLRSRYKQDSIDALVKEIKAYGQIKPGLLRKLPNPQGNIKYRLIYGHSRYKGVVLAGKKYYKAFIREDLTDLDAKLLQSVEDLSETDTPLERATVLNKKYHLKQKQAMEENIPYTKKDFIKEFKHLGDSKILQDALEFMELDEHIRNMVSMNVLGYESALKIGKLSEDDRLNVLYKVMSSQFKGKDIDAYIRKVEEDAGCQSLFDNVEKSYSRILEQFERQSLRPFNYICHYIKTHGDSCVGIKITTPEVMTQFAQIYQSILRLEKSMLRNGYKHPPVAQST